MDLYHCLCADFGAIPWVSCSLYSSRHTPFLSHSFYHGSQILNIHCLVHSISVSVWGPGLALRGETPDDMIKAVADMRDERLKAFKMGFVGTICIQLSACAMAWISVEVR